MTFEEYTTDLQEKLDLGVASLDRAGLKVLDGLAINVMYVMEPNGSVVGTSSDGDAARLVISKIVNEIRAFTGAARAGAMQAAWHHIRAALEIRASVHHLFHDPVQASFRASQFVTFSNLYAWINWKQDTEAVSNGKLSQEKLNTRTANWVVPSTQVLSSWLSLYQCKSEKELAKVKHWHYPVSFRTLLLDTPNGNDLYGIYEAACQATHVSPAGHIVSSDGGAMLVGYGVTRGADAVQFMFKLCFRSLLVVASHTKAHQLSGIVANANADFDGVRSEWEKACAKAGY